MPVLKTASPKVSPSAPYDVPRKARPSSRTSSAGRSLIVAVLSMTDPLYDDPGAEDQEHRDRHHAGDRTAPDRGSVREPHVPRPARHPRDGRLRRAHQAGFPSRTVGRPRRNVATTRAGSSRASYGVLRLRLPGRPPRPAPPGGPRARPGVGG